MLTENSQSLKDKKWLTDAILNAFLMTRSHLAQKLNVDIYTFDSLFAKQLSEGKDDYQNFLKKCDIFKKDILLIPVNTHTNHWILFVVSLNLQTIVCLDSLHDHDKYGKTELSWILKFLKRAHLILRGNNMPLHEWKIHFPTDIPHQVNLNDCGLHV